MFDKIIAFFEFIYLISKYGFTETEKRVNDEIHRLKMDIWKGKTPQIKKLREL